MGNLKNTNDNADTIETAELDKVVADVLNYDNMMNVDMYIDECLKGRNINKLQSNELDLVKILEEQNESSGNEENGYIWVLCTCIMFLGEYKFFWNR